MKLSRTGYHKKQIWTKVCPQEGYASQAGIQTSTQLHNSMATHRKMGLQGSWGRPGGSDTAFCNKWWMRWNLKDEGESATKRGVADSQEGERKLPNLEIQVNGVSCPWAGDKTEHGPLGAVGVAHNGHNTLEGGSGSRAGGAGTYYTYILKLYMTPKLSRLELVFNLEKMARLKDFK